MSDDREQHDYNWAKALVDCHPEKEWPKLENAVRMAVKERSSLGARLEVSAGKHQIEVSFPLLVDSQDGPCHKVLIELLPEARVESRIVASSTLMEDKREMFEATLAMSHEGELRYFVTSELGKGVEDPHDPRHQHLRWQIVRKALQSLLY